METEEKARIDQQALWNGPAGHAWVETQEILDRLFQPIASRLAEAVQAAGAKYVLDIGCGTGATTLEIARQVGSAGRCVGIDISGPMIAAATMRAEHESLPARFIIEDAQSHAFEPERFDMIVSRFGVMFFDDAVAAFANLGSACRRGAELRFFAWRNPAENAFMTAAERAAAPLLPDLPPRHPDAPGQFAFADPDRVRGILEESGWSQVEVQPADFACSLSETELDIYLTRLGPLGVALADADEETKARIVSAVRPAFEPFRVGPEVRFAAACWEVVARWQAISRPAFD